MAQTLSPVYFGTRSGDRRNMSSYESYFGDYTSNPRRTRLYYQVSGTITNVSTNLIIDSFSNSDIALIRTVTVTPIVTRTDGYDIRNFASAQTKEFTSEIETNQDTLAFDFTGSDVFENSLLCLEVQFNSPLPVSVRLLSPPSITVDSSSGSGTGSGSGGSSYSDIENFLRATPRSPSGGTPVYASSPVEFTWSLSKRLSSAEYDGSTLQYRYGSSGAIQTLGSVNYDIAVFNYETGFNNDSQVQWRVRASVKISSDDLRAGGYTDTQLRNAGYEVVGYSNSGSGSIDEIIIGEDGEVIGGSFGDKCTIRSPWSEWTTFQVGDAKVYEATVTIVGPTDDRNGAERIIFKYDIRSDGAVSGSQCQYSLDGGYNWTSLPEQGAKTAVEIPVKAKTFPAGTVRWRARAKANGSYTDNWATASFRVTYDGYGKIVVAQGPIKVGIRRNTRIPVTAGLKAVGNIGNALSFSSAQFCWSSGTGDSFAAIDMPVSGDTASVIIPANTFPSGIIQWYLKGTDSTNVSSETPIYTAYILNNVIGSFPVRPINNISNSDTSLEFVWGYISEDGKKHTKSEIQFSEDGITWNDPIEVE